MEQAPKREVQPPAKTAAILKTPWVPNTRGIIASVLIGIATNLVAQVAERLDSAFFAGTAVPFGFVNFAVWTTVCAMLFGPVGAIISGVLHGLLSTLTATSPLSPVFIFWNFYMGASTGIVAALLQPMRQGRQGLLRQLIVAEFMNFATTLWWTYQLIVLILRLPPSIWVASYTFYVGIGAIPIAVLSIALARAIIKSGVVR